VARTFYKWGGKFLRRFGRFAKHRRCCCGGAGLDCYCYYLRSFGSRPQDDSWVVRLLGPMVDHIMPCYGFWPDPPPPTCCHQIPGEYSLPWNPAPFGQSWGDCDTLGPGLIVPPCCAYPSQWPFWLQYITVCSWGWTFHTLCERTKDPCTDEFGNPIPGPCTCRQKIQFCLGIGLDWVKLIVEKRRVYRWCLAVATFSIGNNPWLRISQGVIQMDMASYYSAEWTDDDCNHLVDPGTGRIGLALESSGTWDRGPRVCQDDFPGSVEIWRGSV